MVHQRARPVLPTSVPSMRHSVDRHSRRLHMNAALCLPLRNTTTCKLFLQLSVLVRLEETVRNINIDSKRACYYPFRNDAAFGRRRDRDYRVCPLVSDSFSFSCRCPSLNLLVPCQIRSRASSASSSCRRRYLLWCAGVEPTQQLFCIAESVLGDHPFHLAESARRGHLARTLQTMEIVRLEALREGARTQGGV